MGGRGGLLRGARLAAGAAVAGALLFALGYALRPFDDAVGEALVGARGLVLVARALAFVGAPGFLAVAVVLAVVALAAMRRFWGALRVGVAMVGTDAATRLLKLAFAIPRPDDALVPAAGFAFPSGHSSAGAALALLVAWFALRHLRGRVLVTLVLASAAAYACAMALSRLVLGVHHLSDVVAGVGLGLVVTGVTLAGSAWAEGRGKETEK